MAGDDGAALTSMINYGMDGYNSLMMTDIKSVTDGEDAAAIIDVQLYHRSDHNVIISCRDGEIKGCTDCGQG